MWNTNCACRTSTSLCGTLVLLACPLPAFTRPRGILTAFPAPLSGWTKYCGKLTAFTSYCGIFTAFVEDLPTFQSLCRRLTAFAELLPAFTSYCGMLTVIAEPLPVITRTLSCRTYHNNHKPLQLVTSSKKLKLFYPINKYDVWKEHKIAILTVPISLTLSP